MTKTQLNEGTEILGLLSHIEGEEDTLKLFFTVTKTIEISPGVISAKKLKKLLGMKIGVIKINGEYRVRRISK